MWNPAQSCSPLCPPSADSRDSVSPLSIFSFCGLLCPYYKQLQVHLRLDSEVAAVSCLSITQMRVLRLREGQQLACTNTLEVTKLGFGLWSGYTAQLSDLSKASPPDERDSAFLLRSLFSSPQSFTCQLQKHGGLVPPHPSIV